MNEPRKGMKSRWSLKYKKSINCSNPKGFSQKNYCKRQKRGGSYLENFKNWLQFTETSLNENIVVKLNNQNAVLFPSKSNLPIDVYVEWENGFGSYVIAAFMAESDIDTHVGIIKNNNIQAGSGPDFGFLKNLIQEISKAKLIAVPYSEKGSSFDPMFKQAEKDMGKSLELDTVKTGFTTGQELPDFNLGQQAQHQLGKSISVSRATGSWAQFFQTDDAKTTIKILLNAVKKAAQPLLDHDFIDALEIKDRYGKSEIIQSQKGKSEEDNWLNNALKIVSQMKYYAEKYLENAPNFKTLLLKEINGSPQWYARKANPKDYFLPKSKLVELNNQSYAENIYIAVFLAAYDNPERVEQLEKISKDKDFRMIADYLMRYFWKTDELNTLFERIDLNLHTIRMIVVEYGKQLRELEPETFDYFINQLKDRLEDGMSELSGLSKYQKEDLADIIKALNSTDS